MSKRRQQKVINQIFKDVAEVESDPGWKTKFVEASYGKFPPGFAFKRGILSFTKSNKLDKLYINDDIYETMINYKEFMTKHTHYKSRIDNKRDIERNQEKINSGKSIEECEWKEIKKKKKIKEVMITNYINKIAIEGNLTDEKKYQLMVMINVGIIRGIIIPSTSIHYENGEIQSIDNIYYDEDKDEFVLSDSIKKKEKVIPNYRDYSLLNIANQKRSCSFDKLWKNHIDSYINKNVSEHKPSASVECESTSCDVY